MAKSVTDTVKDLIEEEIRKAKMEGIAIGRDSLIAMFNSYNLINGICATQVGDELRRVSRKPRRKR